MERQVHDDALEKTVSRRQLLKTLIAAGGAVTASTLLPGEWAEPVVEIGVLPAHAQASPTPSVTPSLPNPCTTPPTRTPRPTPTATHNPGTPPPPP